MRRSAEISMRVNAPNHDYTGNAWRACGLAQLEQAKVEEAVNSLQQSLGVYRRIVSTPGRERDGRAYVADTESFLGQALVRAGRLDEAGQSFREAWDNADGADAQRAEIAGHIADLFDRQGRPDSAAAWRSKGINLRPAG
jgi:tetratricopeptide (TPR) repeat protein